jgi:hypothetical protein
MLVVPLRGDNITNGEGINQTVKQYTAIPINPVSENDLCCFSVQL